MAESDFIPDAEFIPDEAPEAAPAPAAEMSGRAPSAEGPDFIPDDSFVSDEDKYGTLGQQVVTGLEGAAAAATFGLSTGLEKAFGVKPEDIRGRREENPWWHAGGQGAGIVATSLIPGLGAASAGKALGSAGTAAAKLGMAGEGIAAVASREAMRGAVETALFQTGDEVSKLLSEDPNQSFQSAAVSVGLAGVLGAGTGAALGAISPAWKAVEETKVGKFIDDFKARANDLLENPDAAHTVTSEVEQHYNKIRAKADDVYGANGIKAQAIEKMLPEATGANLDKIAGSTNAVMEKLGSALERLEGDPFAPRLQKAIEEYAVALSETPTPAGVFDATQRVKQQLQEWGKFNKSLVPLAERDFRETAKSLGFELRNALEDSSVWGGAADVQKKINSAFKEFLPALEDFERRFTTEVGGVRTIDPGKMATYVKQAGQPNAEIKQEMLKNFLDASEKYEKAILEAEGSIASKTLKEGATRAGNDTAGGGTGGIGGQATDGIALPKDASAPAPGLPKTSPGPHEEIRAAARAHAEKRGLPYEPHPEYVRADPERGKGIAKAYEAMKHAPDDPAVKKAYRALIDETKEQYEAIKKMGVKIEVIEPGMPNPYPNGSRDMMADIRNKHLWVFPTESGFGTGIAKNHPLLEKAGEKIGERELVANDIFRIVHDVFGHAKEGVGFGAHGEENAWLAHMKMYSPEARKAMTSETRGQNSWVNFGPKGEANRLNPAETVYAEQKAGLLPDWVLDQMGSEMGRPELRATLQTLRESSPGAAFADALIKRGGFGKTASRTAGAVVGGSLGHVAGMGPIGAGVGAVVGEHALEPFFNSIFPALVKPILKGRASATSFKSATDYGMDVVKGIYLTEKAAEAMFNSSKEVIPSRLVATKKDIEKLDEKISKLSNDPTKILDMGGDIGDYLPGHAMALGQTASNAVQYLSAERPQQIRTGPLDPPIEPTPAKKATYERTLRIAQQPLTIMELIKDGTIHSKDIKDFHALYPDLYGSLRGKVYGAMIDHISKGEPVPYKMRMGLSLFLGQPLDGSLTPEAIQAAQMTFQPKEDPKSPVRPRKGTSALSKAGDLAQNPAHAREAAKRN